MPVWTIGKHFQNSLIESLKSKTTYTDWDSKVLVGEKADLDAQRQSFNRSAIYLTQEDVSDRLMEVQKKLLIKGYRSMQRGIMRSIVVYSTNEEFPFLERLNDIFHRIRSAGLFDLWMRQDDIVAIKTLVGKNRHRVVNETIDTITFPMFIAYAWLTSFIVLVFEILWYRISKSHNDLSDVPSSEIQAKLFEN